MPRQNQAVPMDQWLTNDPLTRLHRYTEQWGWLNPISTAWIAYITRHTADADVWAELRDMT